MNINADYTLPVILTDESFGSFVEKGVRVVYIKASWCGPCRMMGPVIDELAREYGGEGKVVFGKVDADDCAETCLELKVRSVPTTIIYKDGVLKEKRTGVVAKPVLAGLFTDLMDVLPASDSTGHSEDF
jgi:thioredoxin 1